MQTKVALALVCTLGLLACNRVSLDDKGVAGSNASASNAAASLFASTSAETNTSNTVSSSAPTTEAQQIEGVDLYRRPGQPALEDTYPDTACIPQDVQS